MVDENRIERLNSLSENDRDHLARTVGQAALDLWCMGVSWPDLVDQCLEAVEEDVAAGRVTVRLAAE